MVEDNYDSVSSQACNCGDAAGYLKSAAGLHSLSAAVMILPIWGLLRTYQLEAVAAPISAESIVKQKGGRAHALTCLTCCEQIANSDSES